MSDFWTGQIQSVQPDNGVEGYVKPTGFLENFKAAYNSNLFTNSQRSRDVALEEAMAQRDAEVEKLTGKTLPRLGMDLYSDTPAYLRMAERKKLIDEAVAAHPDKMLSDEDLVKRSYKLAQSSENTEQLTANKATTAGSLGGLLGGIVSGLNPRANPLNVATLPLNWGRTVAERILSNAAIGGGSEAINQFTGVQAWRREAGLENSTLMALQQIGMVSLAGAGFTAVGEGLSYGLSRLANKTIPELKDMQAKKQTTPAENAIISNVESQIRAKEIGQLGDSELYDFAERLAQDAPMTSIERAAVHALGELKTTRETVPFDMSQPGAMASHEAKLNDTISRVADGVLEDSSPVLGADLSKFDGKRPNDIVVNTNDLVLDPQRFQFKSGTDAMGANESLKTDKITQWDPNKAGTITIFKGGDGKLYVADGHQRVNLAKRLIAEGKEKGILVRANVLNEGEVGHIPGSPEPVVWTPDSAMAYAASINMAQGTGSVLDAAKVLRVSPKYLAQLADNALTRDAAGLMKLSDDAFSMVVNGNSVNETYAAIVGQLIRDPKLHLPILKQLVEEGPETRFQAESMVRQMREDAFVTTSQESLFGTEDIVESLYKPKAKVLDKALKLLREDKKIFASLSRNAQKIEGTGGNKLDKGTNETVLNDVALALHNVQTLAYRKGEISDALTEAAKAAKETGKYAAEARKFAETIRQAVARGDTFGDARGVVADVDGPRPAESPFEDGISTGSREISERLTQDTDALAREVGLTPDENQPSMFGDAPKVEPAKPDMQGFDTQNVLYHGSDAKFNEFDASKISEKHGQNKLGFFFTDNKDLAGMYGSNVSENFVRLENPKIITSKQWNSWRDAHHSDGAFWTNLKEKMVKDGHDGMKVKGEKFITSRGIDMSEPNITIVFDPKNIQRVEKISFDQNTPLYHGSDATFSQFDASKFGSGQGKNDLKYGVFLTSSKSEAGLYGKNVTEYRADIKNPLVFETSNGVKPIEEWASQQGTLVRKALDGGHDSIVIKNDKQSLVIVPNTDLIKKASSDVPTMNLVQFAKKTGGVTSHDVQSHLHAGMRSAPTTKTYARWNEAKLAELQAARDKTAREYYAAIDRGEIKAPVEPTGIERTFIQALGDPDMPATQAANRIIEKKGLTQKFEDWKSGQSGDAAGTQTAPAAIQVPDKYADLEVPIDISANAETGEVVAKTVTMRDLANMVQDDELLAKAVRECAL